MTEQVPAPDEVLLIGQVVGPFGIRGQIKVRSYTDQIDHLQRHVRMVYVGPRRQPYRLSKVFVHKPGMLVMSLDGVTNRTGAEDLRGAEVAILEREALPLEQDEYFIHQLYDLNVVDEAGAPIGVVRDVIETGANEVLVVARPDQPEVLIPMIRDVVQQLDIAGGRVVVRLIEGLLP